MENFFQIRGELSMIIGEGYLSAFEASTLKAGDVVGSTQQAGYPLRVHFNGGLLCHGEVVILGDLFGIRVTRLGAREQRESAPGFSDDVVEILPTRIVLGSARFSIAELRDVGPGAFISLGKPYSESEDAELLAAGIPLAAGKVVVIEENMGLRVTRVYENRFEEAEIRASGCLVDRNSEPERIKDYNFKRPDKFTRNALEKLRDIHRLFLRNLKARTDGFGSYRLELVDQCTFGESIAMLQEDCMLRGSGMRLIVAQNVPWERAYPHAGDDAPGRRHPYRPSGKGLIQERDGEHPVGEEVIRFIEQFIKADGEILHKPVFFCFRKDGDFEKLEEEDGGYNALLSCLRGGWKTVADFNFRLERSTERLDDIRIIHENEMVVVLRFRDREAPDGCFAVIYPYITLEAILTVLN